MFSTGIVPAEHGAFIHRCSSPGGGGLVHSGRRCPSRPQAKHVRLDVGAGIRTRVSTEGRAAAVVGRTATPCRLGHSDDTLVEISAGTVIGGRIDSGAADADRVVAGNAAAGTVGQFQRHQPLLRMCSTGRRVLG